MYETYERDNSPEANSTTEAPEQKTHDFKGHASQTSSPHSQPATLPGQGERRKREVKADASVTAGRRVTDKAVRTWDKKDPVAAEREKSVLDNRKATEKLFDSHRRHTSARVRGKKS